MRVYRNSSGEEVEGAYMRSEYVGWSSDKGLYFPFACSFIPSGIDKENEETFRFEAWFSPRTEKKIIEWRPVAPTEKSIREE